MQQVQQLSIRVVGLSLSAVSGASYVLCLLASWVFPSLGAFHQWLALLPGYSWSFGGFLLGLIEAVLYGFWFAVIFVPVYNNLHRNGPAILTEERFRTALGEGSGAALRRKRLLPLFEVFGRALWLTVRRRVSSRSPTRSSQNQSLPSLTVVSNANRIRRWRAQKAKELMV
jgi:hypothetical protein